MQDPEHWSAWGTMTSQRHYATSSPICEMFWQGRRLLEENYSAEKIKFLHNLSDSAKSRIKVILFVGEAFKPTFQKVLRRFSVSFPGESDGFDAPPGPIYYYFFFSSFIFSAAAEAGED
jgi:hypothetical protein